LLWLLSVWRQFFILKSHNLALVSKEPLATKLGLFLSAWKAEIYIV
jgi:hypothetical protein